MGKKVKRKNSDIIWEVWHEDSEILQLMGYNTTNNRSICITRSMFERDWEVVSGGEKETCCICNKKYVGFGHNAEPIKSGNCCDECNYTVVLQKRLEGLK